MQPYTPADYTGDGSAVTLASILGITSCKWFQVAGQSIGSTAARLGDSGVTTSRGIQIANAGSQFAPPIAQTMDFYDLTTWYVLVQNSDKITVAAVV